MQARHVLVHLLVTQATHLTCAPLALCPWHADKREFAPIAAFECRGLELIGWRPEGGWLVQVRVCGGAQQEGEAGISELD